MTKIGLVLILACALTGGLFYYLINSKEPESKPAEKICNKTQPEPKKVVCKAERDIDFGPYMAELQRRIKRAWFPPKGNESRRVQVVFKVHSDGTMSHLRISSSGNVAVADQAALKAVQNAAPFRPLPEGAPPDVDIQFTFDYNVFKGSGGHGTFRRF